MLAVLYIGMLIMLWYGWNQLRTEDESLPTPITSVSIVVSARNESRNILELIRCLQAQKYPSELLEIILVDDHSSDSTFEAIENFLGRKNFPQLKFRAGPETQSKKACLEYGISQSKGELILCTDADCTMGDEWVMRIAHSFKQNKYDLISGPVSFASNSLFSKIQSLEFIGIIASGASFIGLGHPILCNGANLAFTRKIFDEVGGHASHRHLASGDDVFLLQKVLMRKGKVGFIKSKKAIVETFAEEKFLPFLHQRKRWASKNFRKPEILSMAVGTLVLSMNLTLFVCLALGFFVPILFKHGLIFLLIKSFSDLMLLYPFARFLGKERLLFLLLPAQLFTATYTTVLTFIHPILSARWKNRIHK